MVLDAPWEWVSRKEERAKNRTDFSTVANLVRPYVASGDIEGAKRVLSNATKPLVPANKPLTTADPAFRKAWESRAGVGSQPQEKKSSGGGFKGALKRGVGDALRTGGSVAKDIGAKAWDTSNAISNAGYGAVTSQFGDLEIDPATGQPKRDFSLGSVGRALARPAVTAADLAGVDIGDTGVERQQKENDLRRSVGQKVSGGWTSLKPGNLKDAFAQEAAATDASNLPAGAKVGLKVGLDPQMYIAPGAVGKIGNKLPDGLAKTLLTSKASPIGALIEGVPAKAVPKIAIGAGIGSQIATSADIPFVNETIEQVALPIIGGVGGGIASKDRLKAAAREAITGDAPIASMTFQTGRPEGVAPRRVIADSRDFNPAMLDLGGAKKALAEAKAAYDAFVGYADDNPTLWDGVNSSDPAWRKVSQDYLDARNRLAAAQGPEKSPYGDYGTTKTSSPAPLANERLWFHSTRSMDYDLPDPDVAVGTQTGITQGPGVYLAADPSKSAGVYGDRTFVTEFDGTVLDLTKPAKYTDVLYEGGPTWQDVADRVASKLTAQERMAFEKSLLNEDAPHGVFMKAELRGNRKNPNGYWLRDKIASAARDAVGGRKGRFELGRFAGAAGTADDELKAAINNALADSGVDALFHHSPRADGDVLIVLNGEKARVLGDVKNAADAVKGGATWEDMKAGMPAPLPSDIAFQPLPSGSEYVWRGAVGASNGGVRIGTLAPIGDSWHAIASAGGAAKFKNQSFASRQEALDWLLRTGDEMKGPSATSYALTGGPQGKADALRQSYTGRTVGQIAARTAGGAAYGAITNEDDRWGGAAKGAGFALATGAGANPGLVRRLMSATEAQGASMALTAQSNVEASSPRMAAVGSMLQKFEPTGLLAKAYGELPMLREQGAGTLPKWITDAPDLYDDTGLLNFKNVLETTDGLPVSAKASNTIWEALGSVSGGKQSRFQVRVDDPRVYHIKKLYEVNDAAIRDIADYMTETMATPAMSNLARDEAGRALVNGKTLNLVNDNGVTLPTKAGWRDIFENPERYPNALASLNPGQIDQLRAASTELTKIRSASIAMGIKPEAAIKTSAEGFYLPRGKPTDALKEEVATVYRGPKIEGRKAGSTERRLFKSEAAGIDAGKAYPDPIEAFRETITENLRQQNAMHAWNLLKEVPYSKTEIARAASKGVTIPEGAKLGDSSLPRTVVEELGDIRPNIKTLSREKRVLAGRKAIADRDARMLGGQITRANDRIQALFQKATDLQTDGATRLGAAEEMVTTARTSLDDSLSAVRELAAKLPSAGSVDTQAARKLKELTADLDARVSRLSTLERMLQQSQPDTVSVQSLHAASAEDVAYMRQWTADVYAEAAKAEAAILNSPYDDALVTATKAREDLRNLRQMFGANVDDARKRAIDFAIAEGREAKAAVDTRLALTRGQIRELAKEQESRALRVRSAINKSDDLGATIDELTAKLTPLRERRTELLGQVKEVRRIARERGRMFDGEIGLEPGLGVPVPAEVANAFNKALRDTGEPGRFTAVFDLMNNGMRSLGATLDASRQMTVGLLGMADNPGIAAKAVRSGVQATKDPASMWRNLERIQASHPDMPKLYEAVGKDGLQIAAAETSLAAGARQGGGALSKLAQLPGVRQADALYSAPSNIERAERYYKLLEDFKKAGDDYTSPQARAKAASVANLASGRARTGVLAPFVGDEAAGRIAFAGRFVQSQFEVVYNAAFVGGVEGYEARKALLRLAAGGMAVSAGYNAFAEQTGQDYVPWDEFFEIGGPNMGRMRVAGRDVSIFGPWDSLAKGVIRAAQGDPEYFLRSKLAPVPGNVYSALSGPMGIGGEGKNAIGEPVGVTDIVPVPFGLRDIGGAAMATDFTDPAALGSLLALTGTAMLGVKSAPTSPTERLSTIALRLYGEDPSAWQNGDPTGKFYDLLPAKQSEIKKANPALFQEAVERGSEQRKAAEATRAEKLAEQAADDQLLLSGKLDRDKAAANVKTRGAELSGAMGVIYDDEKLNGRKGDALLDEYFRRIDESKVNGVPDFDQVYAWVDTLPAADQKKIDDNTGLNATPVRKLLSDLKSQYYNIPRYVGLKPDVSTEADYLIAVARDRLGPGADRNAVIATMLQFGKQQGATPAVLNAAIGIVNGDFKASETRAMWLQSHPAAAVVTGTGPLTKAEIALLEKELAKGK